MQEHRGKQRDPAKVKVFLVEYLKDFNGARAAIVAGWSERSAKETAYRLLHDPGVQAKLKRQQEKLLKRHELSLDSIVEELRRVAFGKITDVAEWDGSTVQVKGSAEIDDNALPAVRELARDKEGQLRIRMHEKVPALLALGRHFGLKHRLEVTGADGMPLQVAPASVHYHFPGPGRRKGAR